MLEQAQRGHSRTADGRQERRRTGRPDHRALLVWLALASATAAPAVAQEISYSKGYLNYGPVAAEEGYRLRYGNMGNAVYHRFGVDIPVHGDFSITVNSLWSRSELYRFSCEPDCSAPAPRWSLRPRVDSMLVEFPARFNQVTVGVRHRPLPWLSAAVGAGISDWECAYEYCGASPMHNLALAADIRIAPTWNKVRFGLEAAVLPVTRNHALTTFYEWTGAKEHGVDEQVDLRWRFPITLGFHVGIRGFER